MPFYSHMQQNVSKQLMNTLFTPITQCQSEECDSFDQIKKVSQKYLVSIRKKQRKDIIDQKRRTIQKQNQNEAESLNSFPSVLSLTNLADETHRFQIQMIYEKQFYLQDISKLCQNLSDQDTIKKYEGCIGIGKILSLNESHIFAIDQGIVPKFLNLLKDSQQPGIQYISLFIIGEIIDGNSNQCQKILQKGIIPLLLDLMRSVYQKIVQRAMSMMGNIAQYHNRSKYFFKNEANCISIIIDTAERIRKDKIYYLSCWVLSTICQGSYLANFHEIKPALNFICLNLAKRDKFPQAYLQKCFQALYIHSTYPPSIDPILKTDGLPKIIDKLSKLKSSLLESLRFLCNLSTVPKGQAKLLECHIVKQLQILIYHEQSTIRKEVLNILTNLTFNSSKLVSYLMDIKSIQLAFKAMQIMQNDKSCKRQAAKLLISFINSGNPQKVSKFYQQYEMLDRYWSLLTINSEVEIKITALKCIYKLLELGEKVKTLTDNQNIPLLKLLGNSEYINYLQDLQYSPSNEIDREVKRIFQSFFNIQDDSFII